MKKWLFAIASPAFAVLWTVVLAATPAYAGTVRIQHVSLEIKAQIEPGEGIGDETVEAASLQNEKYRVTDCQVMNQGFIWQAASVPEIELMLETMDGSKFGYIGVKNIKVKGSKYEFVSSKREEKDSVLRLQLRLEPLYSKIQEVEWVKLDGNGKASWSPVDSAGSYQLAVFKDGKRLSPMITAYGTSYVLDSYMTEPGRYHIQIRPVSRYNETYKGSWQESQEQESKGGKQEEAQANEGQWIQSDEGWRYVNPGGVYAFLQWQQIDGAWYWFDRKGIMVTGWVNWKGQWYYLQENGAMLSNGVTPDGISVGADGVAVEIPSVKG